MTPRNIGETQELLKNVSRVVDTVKNVVGQTAQEGMFETTKQKAVDIIQMCNEFETAQIDFSKEPEHFDEAEMRNTFIDYAHGQFVQLNQKMQTIKDAHQSELSNHVKFNEAHTSVRNVEQELAEGKTTMFLPAPLMKENTAGSTAKLHQMLHVTEAHKQPEVTTEKPVPQQAKQAENAPALKTTAPEVAPAPVEVETRKLTR